MLKKTITYENFNGEKVTEDFYFNINALEYVRLTAKYGKDLQEYIQDLAKKEDVAALMAVMEDLILSAYGVKSADGSKFVKTRSAREDFEYSAAYADLFIEMLTDPKESQAFGAAVAQRPTEEQSKRAKLMLASQQSEGE